MRMWMLDPSKMCRKHLLGEHVEIHMLVGSIIRGKSLTKFLEYELLEPRSVYDRHEALVEEMIKRGYNHKSDLPTYNFSSYTPEYVVKVLNTTVNTNKSLLDICRRCEICRQSFKKVE